MRVRLALVALLALAVVPSAASARPGDVDLTYGAAGAATVPVGTEPLAGSVVGVRLLAGGLLYAVGAAGDGRYATARLERRLADGSGDISFGQFGGVQLRLDGDAFPLGLALHPTSLEPHVGLFAEADGVPHLAVARLSTAGVADAAYGGGDGIASLAAPGLVPVGLLPELGDVGFAGPVVRSDGRAYVAGLSLAGTTPVTIVAGFTDTGEPDPGFGSGGIVTIPDLMVTRMSLAADGSIYLAGTDQLFSNSQPFATVRLTLAGALDPAFGGDGRVETAVGTGSAMVRGIVLGPSTVTVGGGAETAGGAIGALVRYTSAGVPDVTFDGDGIAVSPLQAGFAPQALINYAFAGDLWLVGHGSGAPDPLLVQRFDTTTGAFMDATTLALGGDVSIRDLAFAPFSLAPPYAAGSLRSGTSRNGVVLKLTGPATLDAAFGSAGVATLAPGSQRARVFVTEAARTADDRLVIGAAAANGGTERAAVLRLTSTGALDGSFAGGSVIVPQGVGQSYVFGIDVDATGRIGAVGRASDGAKDVIASLRLNGNGTAAAAFPPSLTAFPTAAQGGDVLLDGSALIAAGQITVAGEQRLLVTRVLPGGLPDPTFGTAGATVIEAGSGHAGATELLRQPDGKLVVLFFAQQGLNVVGLARLTPTGQLDPTFAGGAGFTLAAPPLVSASPSDLARTPTGQFLVVAGSETATLDGFTVMRFRADGVLDESFATGGFYRNEIPAGLGVGRDVGGLDVAPDGRILVAGTDRSGFIGSLGKTWRLTAAGALDASFGTSGEATLGSDLASPVAVVVAADGRLLVASSGFRDVVVHRLLSDPPRLTSRAFDRRGRTSIRLAGRVTPFGGRTTWWVEYGRTKTYGSGRRRS